MTGSVASGMGEQRAAPAPSAHADAGSRLAVWPKRWLYVVLALAGLALARIAGSTWARSAAFVALALVLLDQVIRWYSARLLARFDRALQLQLQSGSPEDLLALYRGEWLLRWLGPRHEVLDRLGLIHRRAGADAAAAVALRDAVDEAPAKQVPELAQKLADALYAVGEHAEAERYYRISQTEQNNNPGVRARIARMIVARQGDLEEAARLLREAVDGAKGQKGCGVFRCELIEVLCSLGQRDDAIWQLQIAEEELAASGEPEQECLCAARAAVARQEQGGRGA